MLMWSEFVTLLRVVVENKFLFVNFSPDLVTHWMMIKVSRLLCLFSFKYIVIYFLSWYRKPPNKNFGHFIGSRQISFKKWPCLPLQKPCSHTPHPKHTHHSPPVNYADLIIITSLVPFWFYHSSVYP